MAGFDYSGGVWWHGWLAIPFLLWSGVPAILLGRAKLPLADRLHDKILDADANTNKADWQTAGAALLGVVGVGLGLWWADAGAGALISLGIMRDGFTNIRAACGDLMDRRPQRLLNLDDDPLPRLVREFLEGQDWIRQAAVRLREQGRNFLGEALVVPSDERNLTSKIDEAAVAACELDWRLIRLVIMPVAVIPDDLIKVQPRQREAEPLLVERSPRLLNC